MRRARGPFMLGTDVAFPSPHEAAESGLLAVGGELTREWLLEAYGNGIFPWPWYENTPILWWCPDPRFVLYPGDLKASRSLEQRVRSGRFEVRLDTAFDAVIRACATVPRGGGPEGTWITESMIEAFCALHRAGFAHSVESWRDGRLVGGLYGVALGAAFFGESMFFLETDASKVAFVRLARQLRDWGFRLIDCQMETDHLASFGAHGIARAHFLSELEKALETANRPGPWRFET